MKMTITVSLFVVLPSWHRRFISSHSLVFIDKCTTLCLVFAFSDECASCCIYPYPVSPHLLLDDTYFTVPQWVEG